MKKYLFEVNEFNDDYNIERVNGIEFNIGKEVPVREHLDLFEGLLTVGEDEHGLYLQATYDDVKNIYQGIVSRIKEQQRILENSPTDQYVLNLNKMAQVAGMCFHKTLLFDSVISEFYFLDAFALYGSNYETKYYIKKCFEYERNY